MLELLLLAHQIYLCQCGLLGQMAELGVCWRLQGLFSGVGLGLGGLVGGFIYHSYGAPVVFASAAIVLVAGWCLCASAQALVTCCHSLRNVG